MPSAIPPIVGVPTAITAFIGLAASGPVNTPTAIQSYFDYRGAFGGAAPMLLDRTIELFFLNGGTDAIIIGVPVADDGRTGSDRYGDALKALAESGISFGLLVLTPLDGSVDVAPADLGAAAMFVRVRGAFLIADAPTAWSDVPAAIQGRDTFFAAFGEGVENAALYFPRLSLTDATGNALTGFPPSGAIAGVYAATDANCGVWKAPAGLGAPIVGVTGLGTAISDADDARLQAVAINAQRRLAPGNLIWGARTMAGSDADDSRWRYVPVRRLALSIEASLVAGTAWTVFEPNAPPLWAALRTSIGAFLEGLFLKGALQGDRPDLAYVVRCDPSTTSQTDIDNGVVNIVVGFAPLKPAEFVIIEIKTSAMPPS